MSPRLIGMEACVSAHHLSRKLKALGHDARLMPASYVRIQSCARIADDAFLRKGHDLDIAIAPELFTGEQ